MDREQVKNNANDVGQWILKQGKRYGRRLSTQLDDRSKAKTIVKLSTKDGLIAKGSEPNGVAVMYFSKIVALLAVIIVFTVPSFLIKLVAGVGGFYLWLHMYSILLGQYVNTIISTAHRALRKRDDRVYLSTSLMQLLYDIERAGMSGQHTKSLSGFADVRFREDDNGVILVDFEQYGKTENLKLRDWNQIEYQTCYVVPQRYDRYSDVFLVLHSKFTISLSHYAHGDWESFSEYVLRDADIAEAFPQIRKRLEAQRKQEAEAQRQQEIEQEQQQLVEQLNNTGKQYNQRLLPVLSTIIDKKDEWNLNLWDLSKYLKGNKSYARIRCKLRNNAQYRDVKKLESTIERAINADVTINEISSDKSSVYMTVLFETQIDKYQEQHVNVKVANLAGEIVVGRGLTGNLYAEYTNQAQHTLVTGQSGSGKSVLITNLILQLIHLADYQHREMYIASAAKVADFVEFEQAGAYLAEGTDNMIDMLSHVLSVARSREQLFKATGTKNIGDYNYQAKPDEQMTRILVVLDEYETALMTKQASDLESVVLSLLNVGRSSGIMLLIGSQSQLKAHIGGIKDKMMTSYVGYMDRQTAMDSRLPSLGEYFSSLDSVQGMFFFKSANLKVEQDKLLYGDTEYIAVRTPYLVNYDGEIEGLTHTYERTVVDVPQTDNNDDDVQLLV